MRNNRGFTLLEILISIIILGIILTGFFQFFIFSQQTATKNQDKLVGINVAQKVLEQIKEYTKASDAPTSEPLLSYWSIAHPEEGIAYPFTYDSISDKVGNQQYQVTVSVDPKLDNGLQMVTVSVQDNNGKTKSTVKGLVKLWTED